MGALNDASGSGDQGGWGVSELYEDANISNKPKRYLFQTVGGNKYLVGSKWQRIPWKTKVCPKDTTKQKHCLNINPVPDVLRFD
jgi:hypothetical protein